MRGLQEGVRAENVEAAEYTGAAFAHQVFVDQSSQRAVGGIRCQVQQFEQSPCRDLATAGAQHGCTSYYCEFVVAVLVLPLPNLFSDNRGEALSLGQQVHILKHQAFGLFERFTPVSPSRVVSCG